MYKDGAWLRLSTTLVEDNRIEVQEKMLADPTGPAQIYKAGDGRFVTFKMTNIKAFKNSFFAAPEEIKEHD